MTDKFGFPIRSLFVGCALVSIAFALPSSAQTESPEPTREDTIVSPALATPQVDAGQVPEGSVGGMGDINLYPRRIVLDQRQRIASVGIYNKTAFAGDYEVAIADMMMTEEGRIIPLDNLPDGIVARNVKTASEMLRWSPRRVMLPGSEAQTIRVMARPPADLPDGEYRAHFSVVSIPANIDEGYSIDDAVAGQESQDGNVGVTIRPRFGISIPVIFRVGQTTLEVGLENIALIDSDQGKLVGVTITREGTRSAYGDLVITAPGQEEPFAIARGIGVYPEIDARKVVLPLNSRFDMTKLSPGTILTVKFIDDDVAPGEVLVAKDFVFQ